MSKPWKVQVREDHFAVLGANGDEMLVSVKEYASPASAKRAAQNFCEAMGQQFVLEGFDDDGERVELDRFGGGGERAQAAPSKSGRTITPPESGRDRFATNPAYFVA